MSKELSGAADASISTISLATSCVGVNPLSTAIKLSDEMRDAVITAVRDSGQFVEKPADLASAQAAITESINQAVNDALANALKPGGLLYGLR